MSFVYTQLFVTPPYPTEDFSGKTVIVTGSNVGLGLEAARHIVRLNAAKVVLAVRNTSAGETAKKSIESTTGRTGVCEVWKLDLASYDSVQAFAKRADRELPRLDVLLENAGLATDKFAVAEGQERTVTVNVISTFLLALLLLPKLRETAKKNGTTSVLTIVSSEVHTFTKLPEWKAGPNIFETLADEKISDMKSRYPVSKLLEVLSVREMAPKMKKENGVVLNMMNPGLCHSELARNAGWTLWLMKLLLARTTEVGSRTLVHASGAGWESHGEYESDSHVVEVGPWVRSDEGKEAQAKVWQQLQQELEKIRPGIMANLA